MKEIKFKITKKLGKDLCIYENVRALLNNQLRSIPSVSSDAAAAIDVKHDLEYFNIPFRYEKTSEGHFFYFEDLKYNVNAFNNICFGNETLYECV